MSARDYLDMVEEELGAVGVKYTLEHGGKHLIVRWQHNGADRRHVMPASPSDSRRGVINSRADVRRILRADGLIGEDELPIVIDRPALTLRGGQVWGSSLEIAAKFEKQHKDVLRSIDKAISELGPEFIERNFAPNTYKDAIGRSLRSFDLTRDGFSMIAMGFTGAKAMEWKCRYLEAFNAMEAELSGSAVALSGEASELGKRVDFLQGEVSALTELLLDKPQVEPRRPNSIITPSMMRARREARRERWARA